MLEQKGLKLSVFLTWEWRYHDKIDILGRITYTAPMEIVYKAVREWTSTQDRNDYKIRG